MNAFIETIMHRRSIRKYTEQPVEQEKVDILLKTAMAAPTAMNTQPWEFVVITDPEILKKIRKTLIFGKMIAPLAIAVCANLSFYKREALSKFWVQDCSAATQNILLAATSMELGTVWCGVHPINLYEKQIAKILEIPANVKVLNVIYIGYPAETKEARTQYREDRIHNNHY